MIFAIFQKLEEFNIPSQPSGVINSSVSLALNIRPKRLELYLFSGRVEIDAAISKDNSFLVTF